MQILSASYLLPMNGPVISGGAVAVHQGKIVDVGKCADLVRRHAVPPAHYPDAVIIPGLVNAHTHLELTHYKKWCDELQMVGAATSFADWIINVINVKRRIDLELLRTSLRDGFAQLLQSGTTMVGDILSDRRLISGYAESPLAGRVYLECLGHDPAAYQTIVELMAGDLEKIPDNFLPGISPHAPYTVSTDLLRQLLGIARSRSVPVTMHLAESRDEIALFLNSSGDIAEKLYPFVGWTKYIRSFQGTTSTRWLDASDALNPDLLAVHGVHLTPSDIELLRDKGAAVVLAPRSNHQLGVGTAPVAMMIKMGIPLALGTDSLASCDSLSLWDEMRFLLDAFPDCVSPSDALAMATSHGARAIMRAHEGGSLEAGKRADLVVMTVAGGCSETTVHERLVREGRVHEVWCRGSRVYAVECPQES